MGQAATSIGAAAVKEGQRCFDVPLDTTMQNVRMPGGANPEGPDKFYALGLGTGLDGLAPTCTNPRALPPHAAGSTATIAPQGYPRHGDTAPTPMRTEQMLPSRLPSQQTQSFPHSDPFYEGQMAEGYVEEPPSARDFDEVDYTSPDALPTTPSLPMPDWNAQLSTLPPPPPPPPRTNSTQQKPFQQAPPPLASTQASPSFPAQQAPPPVAAQQMGNEELQRNTWTQGSVLEIFSSSSNRWYPALLLKVIKGNGTPDVLTLQFWLSTDEAKQKSLYRNDAQQLSLLGTHLGGELPPGFCVKPSASRPGQSVFLDQTTGMKYQTAELAWQTYFKRLLERPAAGMDTVCQLPHAQSMAVASQQMPANNYSQNVAHPVPPTQQEHNAVAFGLVTEYETHPTSGLMQQQQQQQHQIHQKQQLPDGPRIAPPQKSASNGATISRVPMPTSGQLKATAETRHGAQLAADLIRPPPVHGNPEGPQVTDYRRAIRA
mmetsp:Transcript_47130/g.74459  ORF Transcript_47130/g.74459 Transcript_47130/m.74459 type:complete len:488 (-) Transcript_47130:190-1653(-)|eukprot:CAMPEP_0169114210 /NCGR_PEP_ID=MMETSP1015-20121227/28621_1 /TAXON_ID=342587 /ORGANISM="Karlodinium micrum, Strain CCMP2283" /LENGTH=487 /DNA_ID=CAMNT_0009176447 /DNA_START=43 /DNA_END=1506 /DNA_ORIENTATION=-